MAEEKKMNPVLKVVVLLGAIGLTGTIGYYSYQGYKNWKAKKNPTLPETSSVATYAGKTSVDTGNTPTTCKHCGKESTFPLKKGSQGRQVAAVQYAYNLSFPSKTKLTVDGDWGNASEKAFIELMGIASSFNGGWSNFEWGGATYGSGAVGSTAGSGSVSSTNQGGGSIFGSGASKQVVSINKTVYDKRFKKFENI